jgi:hypothetical protein
MRRLILSILMLLLPLQWSAAAVAEYCLHEKAPPAQQHLGHHAHEHKADAGRDDSGNKSGKTFDNDCASCLAQCFHAVARSVDSPSVLSSTGGSSVYIAFMPDPLLHSLFRPPLITFA